MSASFGFDTPRERGTTPVAGIPALKRTVDGELQRWKPGTITVELDPSLEEISRAAPEAVMLAFGSWFESAPDLPDVKFERSERRVRGASRDGRNTVFYAPIEIAGHGRDLALTISYSDETSGEILEVDIVLNSRHEFELFDDEFERSNASSSCSGEPERCRSGFDLQSIVTHEVGHFWGLGEDRDDTAATMFFCTSRCEVHKRSLEGGDVVLLDRLYGAGTVTTSQAPGCGKAAAGTKTTWRD
jgi:hypothetical protein